MATGKLADLTVRSAALPSTQRSIAGRLLAPITIRRAQVVARVLDDAGVRVADQNLRMHHDAGRARGLGGDLAEPLGRVVQARRLERRRIRRQRLDDRASARAGRAPGRCGRPRGARKPPPTSSALAASGEKSVAQTIRSGDAASVMGPSQPLVRATAVPT